MSTKEMMDKDVSFKDMAGLWKYIKPFVPIYKKLRYDWAYLAWDDGILSLLGVVFGLLAGVVGLIALLGSFHLFFFITIPAGVLCLFVGASLVWFTSIAISGKAGGDVANKARRFNIREWSYKVEEKDAEG